MNATIETTLESFCSSVRNDPFQGIQEIVAYLDGHKRAMNGGWNDAAACVRAHPLHRLLLEDPYTARAFHKPRGYAGDAVMMDFLYRHPSVTGAIEEASDLGRHLCRYSAGDSGPARAVRWRRERVAQEIERMVAERGSLEVFAFACGHLREFELLRPEVRELVRFVAADVDEASLASVRQTYGEVAAIECIRTSVRDLIAGRARKPSRCDLVYTLGLLDYVSDRAAGRVVERLWEHVNPGGELLVANFTPATCGTGYMESVMDWWLYYREVRAMAGWADGLEAVVEQRVFEDPHNQIAYLVARKA